MEITTDLIREFVSPHLAKLAEIDEMTVRDPEAGLQHLARFFASLIRDGAASSELREILARLDRIEKKVDHMTSQQDELNTDVQALSAALGDVATQTGSAVTIAGQIQAEIASLQSANPALDLSGLDALAQSATATASGLDGAVSQLAALVPAPVPTGDGTAGVSN